MSRRLRIWCQRGVEGVLGQVLTDRIWSPSSDFGRPKHGQNYTAATFRQKGVWSQIQIHHLTFYDPSQSLCFRVTGPTVETDLMELDMYFVGTPWGKVFFLDSKGSLRHY